MSQLDVAPSRVGPEEEPINEECFQAFLDQRDTEPSWLKAYRKANWKRYKEIPSPNRKAEAWRFGDPRRMTPGSCAPILGRNGEDSFEELSEGSSLFPSAVARIVLVNDHCIEEANLPAALRNEGLVFESLESALLKRPD
ncbi:MAG: hypothetical protein VCA36_05490, partial [Opitutales bacterium]